MTDDNAPERAATGREYFELAQGPERAQEILDAMAELHPALPDHVVDHAFDAIYTRPGLTLQQRQLITVIAVATIPDAEFQLASHLRGALNLGITADELREALLQISLYVGFPRAVNALTILKDVLETD
ncbi:MAG TPA: carboxymuconolactone decarboxylase family protein [Baekduia sp.]|nr:carboxymuconolactone decarboxylase family protein [Baekduia sp.]